MKVPAESVEQVSCTQCGKRIDVSEVSPFTRVACPQCGAAFHVPVKFGRFQLLSLLGKGRMSRVYRARDLTLQRPVAIKLIQAESDDRRDHLKNCLEEARALASLNHPNVVQIHSVEQQAGTPFIVMELVEGLSLEQVIANKRTLPENRVLEIGIDVAEGLKAASRVGLIHGDVKPGNILIDRRGVAKLVDFGIARSTTHGSKITAYGTPHYVAPEVALNRNADHRADIYSLGATLFHAATGDFPFVGQTTNDMILSRLDASSPDPRSLRPALHPETADLIMTTLHPYPDGRYASLDELLRAMYAVVESIRPKTDELDLSELDQAARSVPVRSRKAVRRKGWKILRVIIAAAVIALGMAGLIAVLLWGVSKRV